jgi:hypothetical protein
MSKGLEYLKVLLSWPPVAGGALLILVIMFRTELHELVGRLIRRIEGKEPPA